MQHSLFTSRMHQPQFPTSHVPSASPPHGQPAGIQLRRLGMHHVAAEIPLVRSHKPEYRNLLGWLYPRPHSTRRRKNPKAQHK